MPERRAVPLLETPWRDVNAASLVHRPCSSPKLPHADTHSRIEHYASRYVNYPATHIQPLQQRLPPLQSRSPAPITRSPFIPPLALIEVLI